MLELDDARNRLVIDYSAGMRKKIGLATALLHAPKLLVLDEPFEAVDPVSAATIRTILQRFVAAGGAVVLSSHVMALVEQLCTHVAVITRGRVVATGPVAEVRGDTTLGGGVRAHRRRAYRWRGGVVVVGVLIQMKWRILRNSLRGKQAAMTGFGAVFGLLAAFVTILAAVADSGHSGDVLAAVYLLWTVGWLFAPVLTGGGDETLRPDHFALLPLRPRQLATGLLGAAFVGVPAVVTFLAFTGLVLYADGAAAVAVALVMVFLQLVFVVLLSRVVMAGLGAVLRSRRGRDLGVVLAALVGLSGWFVQSALNSVGPALAEGRSPTFSTVLRAVPSGWGTVAVDAAARGDWLLVLGGVAGLAMLVAGLLAVWGVLLVRRSTKVEVNAGPAQRRTGSGVGTRLPATRIGAVAGKELRTWTRDARRRVALLSMLIAGAAVGVVPALNEGDTDSLPFVALLVVFMACMLAGNLYGMDGSALWHTLVVPGAEAADVRGRQLAWLLIVGPVALVLALVVPGLTDPDKYPWVLAIVPALLGGGAGLVVVLSVYTAYPLPDQRANPFAAGGSPGVVRVFKQLGIVLLLLVVALPEGAVLVVGTYVPAMRWFALPLGIGVGVLCWWWFGRARVPAAGRPWPRAARRRREAGVRWTPARSSPRW